MSLSERNCVICGTPFTPKKCDHICCRRECSSEHRRRSSLAHWQAMKAELAREPESIRTMKKEGGQISNLSPRRARPVSCKCPACGRMRTVKMIPPKSGITPRIYCPKHIRRRFVDTDCDPLLGTYAVGW